MTKILTNLILIFLAVGNASGQTNKSLPQQKLEDSVNRMIKQLESIKSDISNLSDEACLDRSDFLDKINMEIYRELTIGEGIENEIKDTAIEVGQTDNEVEENQGKKEENHTDEQDNEEFRENFKKKFKWDWDFEKESQGWEMKLSRRTRTYFNYTLGLNNLVVRNDARNPDLNTWGSRTFEVGIITKTRLGEKRTAPNLTYGISYMHNNFRLNDSELAYIDNNTDTAGFIPLSSNISSSSFCVSYLTIPVGMELKLGKKAVLGFNVFGGLRLRTSKEVEYNTDLKESVREKTVAGYRVSDFAYGAKVYMGGRMFSVFGRYDFTSLLSTNNDYNILAFGIRFDL